MSNSYGKQKKNAIEKAGEPAQAVWDAKYVDRCVCGGTLTARCSILGTDAAVDSYSHSAWECVGCSVCSWWLSRCHKSRALPKVALKPCHRGMHMDCVVVKQASKQYRNTSPSISLALKLTPSLRSDTS